VELARLLIGVGVQADRVGDAPVVFIAPVWRAHPSPWRVGRRPHRWPTSRSPPRMGGEGPGKPGSTVLLATGAVDAWRALEGGGLDEVLTDGDMANPNGRKPTRRIRGRAGWAHRSVVAVTNRGAHADAQAGWAVRVGARLRRDRCRSPGEPGRAVGARLSRRTAARTVGAGR
jgi:CheY-like chemotaxis protein